MCFSSHRGVFQGSAAFYGSSGDPDEMCEAAVWLYRATGNNDYLQDAKGFVETAWGWALSWDDKKVACQVRGRCGMDDAELCVMMLSFYL